jgi:large subunit ribosomal protein L9
MKVILKENIENLGKRGDIIDVAAGYGRNYLLPRKIAIEVTPSNIKMVEMEQKALRKKLEKEVISYQSVIDRLSQTSLSFERKAGDKDVIFGSVSTADIKEALDRLGIEVDKKKILLADPIKRLGNFTVPIKVFHDERAEIKIEVKKEGAEEETKKEVEEEKPVTEETAREEEEAAEESATEPESELKTEPTEEPEEKTEEPAETEQPAQEEKAEEEEEKAEEEEEKTEEEEEKTEEEEEKTEEEEGNQADGPEKEPEEAGREDNEEEKTEK